jgi:phage terminase large subunit-like protein
LKALADEAKKSYPYRFDEGKANFACRFLQLLPHVKGEWARPRPGHSTLLKLEPWQCFMTCCIMGWVEKRSGFRQFTEVYLEIPRKNAKSTWAAGIGLLLAFGDGEFGAEVYCGATTERQAMEVFRTALQMTRRSPEFCRYFGVEFAVKSIYREEDGSRFTPVVGNPGDGASPSCAILDEMHEHATPALLDTMRTGMGARQQPLLVMITTAGSNLAGPCYAERNSAIKVLAGQIDMPSLFALIYTVDVDDDWTSLESLRKANPNYGVSVKAEFLERELRRAIQSAHLQAIFKTKHLNIWVGAAAGWMNMQAWAACGDTSWKLDDFIGQPCYEGVDLAARIDLASRVKVYRRTVGGQTHYYVFGRHYVPHDATMSGNRNASAYAAWVAQGYLVPHQGVEIDLDTIQKEIEDELPRFKHECIAFDQYSAQQMQQSLARKTREDVVITIPQTTQYLSEPMKEIEAAVMAGRLHHNCDPVLTWAMSNVVARVDANDNVFPRKEQPDNKIDPVSALINAMNRAAVAPPARRSVYATRGILTL